MAIEYRAGNDLDLDQVIELYQASTLGERRPIHDRPRFSAMLRNANLVITAWDHQKRGIGKELIRLTQLGGGPNTTILLLAAPAAEKYYPRLGFSQARQAWLLNGGEPLR